MSRDLTTEQQAPALPLDRPLPALVAGGVRLLAVGLVAALLLALLYQIPATHTVDIGGYDAAYTQGFYDAERADSAALAGSNGSARWTRAISYLVFPQAGLPAEVTLRLRGRAEQPGELVVLLNSTQELGRIRPGAAWETHTFTITGGLLKPNDVVIELRADTGPAGAGDGRVVGVLLDSATYRVGPAPISPYPAQLAYGALAAMLLVVLFRPQKSGGGRRTTRRNGSVLGWLRGAAVPLALFGVLCVVFLFLYRLQPPYPYPLRGLLPGLNLILLALVLLRYGPVVVRRAPALLDAVAIGGVGAWLAAVLVAAQNHVTLSLPGVENDFGVFARRSTRLVGTFQPSGEYPTAVDGVLRADGFYNIGYPFLLWLLRPLTQGNVFVAAQLISALSGALLLLATWWLARRMLGRGAALLALLVLAFSPLVVQYALYVGTDMLFAALVLLALAVLLHAPLNDGPRTTDDGQAIRDVTHSRGLLPPGRWLAAGVIAGLAFLVRHPGLALLPFGLLALWWLHHDERGWRVALQRARWALLAFVLAFVVTIAPQLVVNLRDTGQPLFNQQAKNVWLAVFAGGDWQRWDEAPNSIPLSDIVARDPGRFAANWWLNLRAYVGTGGEDTSEFGRAIQLRLLGFPTNWLALAGLLGWLLLPWVQRTDPTAPSPLHPRTRVLALALLAWVLVYVLAVSVGLALPRFFLPLAPVYALAAAWASALVARQISVRFRDAAPANSAQQASRSTQYTARATLLCGMLLGALTAGGFGTGTGYVLANQSADQVAAVRLVQATVRPGERLVAQIAPADTITQYSAIAHLLTALPTLGDPVALREAGVTYLLHSAQAGPQPDAGVVVGQTGLYTLYRLVP